MTTSPEYRRTEARDVATKKALAEFARASSLELVERPWFELVGHPEPAGRPARDGVVVAQGALPGGVHGWVGYLSAARTEHYSGHMDTAVTLSRYLVGGATLDCADAAHRVTLLSKDGDLVVAGEDDGDVAVMGAPPVLKPLKDRFRIRAAISRDDASALDAFTAATVTAISDGPFPTACYEFLGPLLCASVRQVHGDRDAPPGLRNMFSHAPVADVATFAALAEHVGAVAGAINRTAVW